MGTFSTFVGYVFPDESGNVASKVRAIGADGTVCGTTSVRGLLGGGHYYELQVAGASTRAGCPAAGEGFAFRLLFGAVDSGEFAVTSQPVRFTPGVRQLVSLTPAPADASSAWLGEMPSSRGEEALLVWVGVDGTGVRDALARLDLPPGVSVFRAVSYEALSGELLSFTPGGPGFLQSLVSLDYGDVVRVRVK